MGGAQAVHDGPSGTRLRARPPQKNNNRGVLFCRPPPFFQSCLHASTQPTRPPGKRERPTSNETDHNPARTTEGTTETRWGGDLGVGVGHDERAEREKRGQDEETPGETQAAKGFAFPQCLKERQRERERHYRKGSEDYCGRDLGLKGEYL